MDVSYLHLPPGQPPPGLNGGPLRVAIVSEIEAPEDWRHLIAEWLVRSHCLYLVAWGVECGAWHDAVDWANLEEFEFADIPPDRFIFTTDHAKESLSDALWFAGQCAWHPDVELADTLLLHVADQPKQAEMLGAYSRSQAPISEA